MDGISMGWLPMERLEKDVGSGSRESCSVVVVAVVVDDDGNIPPLDCDCVPNA